MLNNNCIFRVLLKKITFFYWTHLVYLECAKL